MKKYLLVAMTLCVVGANAQKNPFDLQKNLQKIDSDQAVLLSALQEMANNKDEFADDEDAPAKGLERNPVKDELPQSREAMISSELPTRPEEIRQKVIEEEVKSKPSNDELISRLRGDVEVEEAAKKDTIADAAAEEERIKKVKEAQVKIEEARAAQVKAEATRVEAEKREVAIYEAERLAKKIEEEKLLALKKEEALAKKEAIRVAKEASAKEEMLKVEATKEIEAKKNAIVDINITKEQMMAKTEADNAYLEAVREMD